MNLKKKLLIISLIVICIPVFFLVNAIRKDFLLKHYLKNTTFFVAKSDFMRLLTFRDVDNLNSELPDSLKIEKIDLIISENVLKKIDAERKSKLDKNIINGKSIATYYSGTIKHKNTTIPIRIRIRGDTQENFNRGLYHTSFRINTTNGTILGFKKMSLIRPFNENNFFGFFYYNFLKTQNIITPNFHLVHLSINGKSKDLWVLQEGFEQTMLKKFKRPEGLILHFENDCIELNQQKNASDFPKLIPYNYKLLKEKEDFSNQYNYVLNKINLLQKNKIQSNQIFDFELWAKFIVLNDIFFAHHSQMCHNIKMYFNPETKLLEPIAWDPSAFKNQPFLPVKTYYSQVANDLVIYKHFAQNNLFAKLYLTELKRYTNDISLLNFINKYKYYIKTIEPELNRHQVSLKFDSWFFFDNMNKLKQEFNIKHKISFSIFKNERIAQIENTTFLPIYISYIELDNQKIVVNKLSYYDYPIFIKIDKIPKKATCFYQLNNETILSREKATIFNYNILN